MTAKEEKFIAKWEKTQRKGKTRFILFVMLVFLIVFPIVNVVISQLQGELGPIFEIGKVSGDAFVGLVLGLFLGRVNWNANEKKYVLLTSKYEI